MNKKKIVLGVILVILGMIGVASILTMKIPIPPDAEAILKEKFTPIQIKLLTLINPAIMLIVAVFGGVMLHEKVKLQVPVIQKVAGLRDDPIDIFEILRYGILAGILSGILLSLVGLVFNPIIPSEFVELGEKLKLTLAARFLYGGFTEEILMRFGLMTFLVWICSKIFRGLKPEVYWTGIVVAAVLFAIGHFPIAFQSVDNPSFPFLAYILIGNSIGGIIFGWVYWKKGLEGAFLAHLFTHVILVFAGPFVS